MRAVDGGIEVRRTMLTGEEDAIRNRITESLSRISFTRQGMGITSARPWVGGPVGGEAFLDALADAGAEGEHHALDGEVLHRGCAGALKVAGIIAAQV